jgi:hypothetical protein
MNGTTTWQEEAEVKGNKQSVLLLRLLVQWVGLQCA